MVSGAKSVSSARCKQYRIPFTPEVILAKDGNENHRKAYQNLMNRHSHNVRYYSSWTINNEYLNRCEKGHLKDLFTAFTTSFHLEIGPSSFFGFGVPKFNTDRFFKKWGMENVNLSGRDLPKLPASLLGGIDSYLMFLESFSPYALELSELNKNIYDEKIIFGQFPEIQIDQEAA